MSNPILPRLHGGIRGSALSRGSVLFGGPFGRMFRALPPADYGKDDAASVKALEKLAAAMLAAPDPIRNGPDPEESGIPAAFTYFGQFVDHDLTFDPASSLQKQNDPDALVDYRTPRFDLDNVYGRGPDDQPYLYSDGLHFNLGRALTGAAHNPGARDLPRSHPLPTASLPHPARRAIIGDPRNDENVIVSQLQGLFLRFHNLMADKHGDFAAAQRAVRWHYQWIVLNDFLPKIVAPAVLAEVLPHVAAGTNVVADPPRLLFYHARNEAFMPLEFSAAAYRYGHSMVRPEYQLNETLKKPHVIFAGNSDHPNLRGFREFPADWAIDWRFFIDLETLDAGSDDDHDPHNDKRMQLAYKIDTSLVNPLGHLPRDIGFDPHALGRRNLERGWRMRLPSGQAVARAMGEEPLADAAIKIGKFTADPDDQKAQRAITAIDTVFADNCPLWTYILAETVETDMIVKTSQGDRSIATPQLGPVGGRIVAETMVGLMREDSTSFLAQHPLWTPDPALMENGRFGLRELVKAALSG